MEARIKPIPAFYCCYLLRSTVRHASLYVGSSPHPVRRLNQHNGNAKGGAVRTSRLSLRPWEMTCIVAGFPSNIAALQFEWAWQNPHLTRHISQDDRLSFPVVKTKTNTKTGKTRRKPTRPRTSLRDTLSNLHLLLRSNYFSKWPLELRFFSQDVYSAWQLWSDRVDGKVRRGIKVILDLPQPESPTPQEAEEESTAAQRPKKRRKVDLIGKGGVEGIDTTYAKYQDVYDKSHFILDEDDQQHCGVCKGEIDVTNDLFTVCTADGCMSLSHVTCIGAAFLSAAGSTHFVPDQGECPGCHSQVEWPDLMRALSLRIRGEKDLRKLSKTKRSTKVATAAEIMEIDESQDDDDNDDNDDVDVDVDVDDEEEGGLTAADLVDEAHEGYDEDDGLTVASVDSFNSAVVDVDEFDSPSHVKALPDRLEIVIEDSEDE